MATAPAPISPKPNPPGTGYVRAPDKPFLQRKWVQQYLPLATSLAVHVAIIVLALAFVETARQVVRAVTQEQVIIPDSTLAESGPAGGIPNPGLGEDPNRASVQAVADVSADAQGWAERPSESLTRALVGPGAAASDSIISVGEGAAIGKLTGGTTGGDGGQLAPFGVPGGGAGSGPRVSFFGVGGNARRIVYLVDATGSAVSIVKELRNALFQSIDPLNATQSFNVIIFKNGKVLSPWKGKLERATRAKKDEAIKWIEQNCYIEAGMDPRPAIEQVFKLEPQLVFVVSDGFDRVESFVMDPEKEIVGLFRRLNTGGTKVNTLFCPSVRGSDEKAPRARMQKIAEENGGVFKVIGS